MLGTLERERAGRGAEAFDKINPDWYQEVDPGKLDLANGHTCVVGQLYGLYNRHEVEVARLISQTLPTPVDTNRYRDREILMTTHGLYRSYGIFDTHRYSYSDLTRAWREEIAKRRVEAGPRPTWRQRVAAWFRQPLFSR